MNVIPRTGEPDEPTGNPTSESAAPQATTFTAGVHGRTGGRRRSGTAFAQVRPTARDVYLNTGRTRAYERRNDDLEDDLSESVRNAIWLPDESTINVRWRRSSQGVSLTSAASSLIHLSEIPSHRTQAQGEPAPVASRHPAATPATNVHCRSSPPPLWASSGAR